MSENQSDQGPKYGEETDQEPHYPADGGTSEDAQKDGQESDLSPTNSDLHGAAKEVEEDASGDGAAKTPGG